MIINYLYLNELPKPEAYLILSVILFFRLKIVLKRYSDSRVLFGFEKSWIFASQLRLFTILSISRANIYYFFISHDKDDLYVSFFGKIYYSTENAINIEECSNCSRNHSWSTLLQVSIGLLFSEAINFRLFLKSGAHTHFGYFHHSNEYCYQIHKKRLTCLP